MGLGNTAPQQGCSGQPLFLPCHLLSFKYEIWHLITGSDDSEVSHNAVIKPKVCIHRLPLGVPRRWGKARQRHSQRLSGWQQGRTEETQERLAACKLLLGFAGVDPVTI